MRECSCCTTARRRSGASLRTKLASSSASLSRTWFSARESSSSRASCTLGYLPARWRRGMTSDLTIVQDLSTTPGALELKLTREIADGRIDYFEAEAGWLTLKGEPRINPYRKYMWTEDGQPAVKLPSTSSILDAI